MACFFPLKPSWSEAMMQTTCRNQMLGTTNRIGLIFKPKLSCVKSPVLKHYLVQCAFQDDFCLNCLISSSCSIIPSAASLSSLDCFPQSTPHIGFNNQLAKKVFNPSQLADPSTSTANLGLTCQVFSHSTIPTKEGKRTLNLSWKVVSSVLLLISLHKTELEEGSL